MYAINKNKKEEQTGIEPVTLGPAIPRSTTELLFLIDILQSPRFMYRIANYYLPNLFFIFSFLLFSVQSSYL